MEHVQQPARLPGWNLSLDLSPSLLFWMLYWTSHARPGKSELTTNLGSGIEEVPKPGIDRQLDLLPKATLALAARIIRDPKIIFQLKQKHEPCNKNMPHLQNVFSLFPQQLKALGLSPEGSGWSGAALR